MARSLVVFLSILFASISSVAFDRSIQVSTFPKSGDEVAHFLPQQALTVTFDIDAHRDVLTENFVIQNIGADLSSMAGQQPVEALLSEFAQASAYQLGAKEGPNCFHATIASLTPDWTSSNMVSILMPTQKNSAHGMRNHHWLSEM